MRIEVRHRTQYRYDAQVFLEPYMIRLRPGADDTQRPLDFHQTIEPAPAAVTELLDAENNLVSRAWFEGTHDHLTVEVAFTVETLRANPFDYVLLEPATLPAFYPEPEREALARFLTTQEDEAVTALASSAPDDAQGFAIHLATTLAGFKRYVRDEGDPLPAAETLAARAGSCRDLTVLFMAAARARGLAARFVSGYTQGDPDEPEQHMHAWAEVYIPGGGWRGFDPTFGLAVADRHVWVARAPTSAGAAPTSGTYRGTGVGATMDATVVVTVEE